MKIVDNGRSAVKFLTKERCPMTEEEKVKGKRFQLVVLISTALACIYGVVYYIYVQPVVERAGKHIVHTATAISLSMEDYEKRIDPDGSKAAAFEARIQERIRARHSK